MKSRRGFLLSGAATGMAAVAVTFGLFGRRSLYAAPVGSAVGSSVDPDTPAQETFEVVHTDAQWRRMLDANAYQILRHGATERPYSSPLNDEHRAGTFACAGCRLNLFSSRTKFDSHTGWPSFWQPLDHVVATSNDYALGTLRSEVHCRRCGGHLGHVFDDGPKPTGLRYCMNGFAMTFTQHAT
jgi:peptide-methionine (R)-S-oxide reductase